MEQNAGWPPVEIPIPPPPFREEVAPSGMAHAFLISSGGRSAVALDNAALLECVQAWIEEEAREAGHSLEIKVLNLLEVGAFADREEPQ